MKITSLTQNSRKRCFILKIGSREYEFSFSYLAVKPSARNPIRSLTIDKDTGKQSFSYKLKDGRGDTVLAEQVLHVNQDPEVLRKELLYKLTYEIQELIAARKLTKRSVARLLNIHPAQLYRLLDQKFYGKTIDQMIRVFAALGETVEITHKSVA